MSPLPFRTVTGMRHGAGRIAVLGAVACLPPERGMTSSVAKTASARTTAPIATRRGIGLRSGSTVGTGRPASSRASRLSIASALAYSTVAASASSGRAKRYTLPSSSQRTCSTERPDRFAVSSTVSLRCRRARASADSSPIGSSGSTSSMPVVILLLDTATFYNLIGKIDVAWRVQIVTGDECGRERAKAGVRNLPPGTARDQQRMEADAAIGRADPVAGAVAPGRDDAVDRARVDSRPVPEDDDGSLDVAVEGLEAAAQRRSRSALPVRTADRPRARLHLVRAEDHDHLADLGALVHAADDRLEQHRLLRRSVACRRSGSQDDGGDHTRVIRNAATRRVGRSVARLPSRPIFSTTFSPFVTTPRIA